ncbi:hypothetical protein [Senegalimassilia sp.]
MTQGKKMPAGVGSRGGLVREILHHEIVTQLGTFRPVDVLLLGAAALTAYAVCSGVLQVGYMIAKGMLF